MTITVTGPDGSNVAFPDGTPQADIVSAMDAHFGKGGKPPAQKEAPGIVEGVGRGIASGVPIIGGLANKADAAINATLAPLLDKYLPDNFEKLPEGSWSERYQHALDIQRAKDAGFEKEHPVLNTAAELAGGTGALGLAAKVPGVASALGMGGGTLPQMITRGAMSGAGLGAADALTRGTDPRQAAEINAITGAAGPIVGRAIGGAVDKITKTLRPPPVVPENFVSAFGKAVPVSSGQISGDTATQMMEQAASRGAMGQGPQQVAEQFFQGQQVPALQAAKDAFARHLDPYGQVMAESPQRAGEIVSERVSDLANAAKQKYRRLYDQFGDMPGEVESGALDGIGQKIKTDLTNRENPVFVDDKITPVANSLLADIDSTISRLRIPNSADPLGPPRATTETKTILSGPGFHIADDVPVGPNIVGVSLKGINQIGKRIGSFYSAAKSSGNAEDLRAVNAIGKSFWDRVEGAIDDGLFTGSEDALPTLKAAKQAFSDYKRTFSPQGPGDEVGRIMQRILGRFDGQAASPTEISNWLYGASGIGNNKAAVPLALRLKNMFGDGSAEWNGVRQGMWSKLVEPAEGKTDWGPQKISERLYEFLNGSGRPLAQTMFSKTERDFMGQYAGLLKQLVPKPGTVNYSNTAGVLRMLAGNALSGITSMLGAEVAGPAGALAGYGANKAAKALAERNSSGMVARSLYNSPSTNAAEGRSLIKAGNIGAFGSRALMPLMQPNSP